MGIGGGSGGGSGRAGRLLMGDHYEVGSTDAPVGLMGGFAAGI